MPLLSCRVVKVGKCSRVIVSGVCEVGRDQLSDYLRGQLYLVTISMYTRKDWLILFFWTLVHRPTILRSLYFINQVHTKSYYAFPLLEAALKPYLLAAFAKLRKATVSFIVSIRLLSFCPHGITRLPLDGFSWNLIFEYFLKSCWGISSFIKIWQE